MKKHMKKVLLGGVASAAVAVGIAAPTAGVAHADYLNCSVSASGAMWCQDWETGQSWEAAPQGSYPDNPYCSPVSNWKTVQCGD